MADYFHDISMEVRILGAAIGNPELKDEVYDEILRRTAELKKPRDAGHVLLNAAENSTLNKPEQIDRLILTVEKSLQGHDRNVIYDKLACRKNLTSEDLQVITTRALTKFHPDNAGKLLLETIALNPNLQERAAQHIANFVSSLDNSDAMKSRIFSALLDSKATPLDTKKAITEAAQNLDEDAKRIYVTYRKAAADKKHSKAANIAEF